ncbi:glycosyltransferase involved in cell wall biosynthesis [Neolewinella xylanilytica]|uniref:Glycosyltransferase involved in cell wall biosynthesis n=1 Tax=Neolewinella xylanilytica TaxID=1514080 RepID=A0A2S6I8M2_9BACT|nr:glycosyltransferase family 4 protein [Neolewinella xylanilytica]PPK87829.1 glycosyltransferase involved in cell wall biosynthesis [Neolewinella xylanilytica]
MIHAFHLLNDFSGSPKVLRQVLQGLAAEGHPVELHTSLSGRGFLSDIPGVGLRDNRYRFIQSVPRRLLLLLFSQVYVIVSGWKRVRATDTVYVNTLLPFGGAILGWLCGARVIYHLHETSVNPWMFKQFLLFWVRVCATEVIYVSDFLAEEEPLNKSRHVIWNAIPEDFSLRAAAHLRRRTTVENVLMVASLKRYKGVDEYVALADACPEFHFELVVNAAPADIAAYFGHRRLPGNLIVFPAQQDVHPFYRRADVVVNLSRPDEWVETFGLTALEGMVYGLPVIVPPAGGIAEIVPVGYAGYHIDGRNTERLAGRLREWRSNPDRYRKHGAGAREQAGQFTESRFLERILAIVQAGKTSEQRKTVQMLESM